MHNNKLDLVPPEAQQSGSTQYYDNERGNHYFERQDTGGHIASIYNQRFFKKYISNDDVILDFGCGGGHLLQLLPGKHKVGIDVNPSARAAARSKGLSVYASIEDIENEKFNCVITSHALEHVANPFNVLVGLRKLLMSGGTLVWLSPMDDWHNPHQQKWVPNNFDMHLYTWTPLTIGNLVSTAGYQLQTVQTITHAIPPRMHSVLWQLNPKLFDLAAYIWASITSRRQLLVVAKSY